MQISTNEFLLGSLNDILAQEQNVNQLNREIATGQTLIDASDNPSAAGEVIGLTNQVGTLNYDTANGAAATQTLQSGVSALQQVTTLLDQLQSTVTAAANGGATTESDREADVTSAQSVLQQLVQLSNTQGSNGGYLFAGSKSNAPAFSTLPSGQVVFNGDDSTNQVQIAPSLTVNSTISGQNVFTNVPAGSSGVAVSASSGNTGGAYVLATGVTSVSQFTAASLAGTQYDISFSGSGSNLTYQVTSGHGAPGSTGYDATSGVVASGSYTAGADLTFGGIDVEVNGTPAAGDSFAVQPGAKTSLFQIVQNFISALGMTQSSSGQNAQAQQALQNVLSDLGGAQTGILTAQAALGTSLSEIQSVATQTNSQTADANSSISDLQSANLPEVIANYSESLTALQAAEESFAKVQNLTLFQYLQT
jgi:flagellar hook-associated protein 3 FlgL